MTPENVKQEEWEQLAKSETSHERRVLRPCDKSAWELLSNDIASKLELNSPDLTLLDVGCGNAFLIKCFAHILTHVSGVDFSPTMVSEAKKNVPSGDFKVAEAWNLEFQNNHFDRVLSYSVFHYFKSEDDVFKTIDQMLRVTKKGGIILIGDLLDKSKEKEIKSKSLPSIEVDLPLIKRYSEWLFLDFESILDFLRGRGLQFALLDQPNSFKTAHYRKDIKIWK